MKTNQEHNLMRGEITQLRRALVRVHKHLVAQDQVLQREQAKCAKQLRSVELVLALRQVRETGNADG